MPSMTPGLHHVTAITADPQANLDFYGGTLGLRLVKLTVNFDDPSSYHLYYGDEAGRPGTILTFFAWPGARRGRVGSPQATVTSFSVPEGSLGDWADRLAGVGVATEPVERRPGVSGLRFLDPDGMALELVATPSAIGVAPKGGPVPPEHAIRGLHGVTLIGVSREATAQLLTGLMGYRAVASDESRVSLVAAVDGLGSVVDLLDAPETPRGALGAGIVHHIAFRTPDDDTQRTWVDRLAGLGLATSPVMDRTYFHSIYFREPGGVLFEVATDGPGFATDEPADQLGRRLMLPSAVEGQRLDLEKRLPPLRLPTWDPPTA